MRGNVMQSRKFIKSGAGSAYEIKIEGIELDTPRTKIVDVEPTRYGSYTYTAMIPVKRCVCDYWSAEGYYNGVDSNWDMFSSDDDRIIDGGVIQMVFDTDYDDEELAISMIPSVVDIRAVYGAGWSHVYLPDWGMRFDYSELKDDYDGYSISDAEIRCHNISTDINEYFRNPEDYEY